VESDNQNIRTESRASLALKGFKEKTPITRTQSTVPAQAENPGDNMILIALEKGLSMEEVGQLIAHRNNEINRLARLAYFHAKREFQAICPNLIKSKSVDFNHKDGSGKTSYKYADLATIQDIIREPLSMFGLSVAWTTTEEKNLITVTCTCSHEGGHSESTSLTGEADASGKKNAIQSKASTITYLRRYTLTGILGISTGDIDNDGVDGNSVSLTKILKLEKPNDEQYKKLVDSLIRKTITLDQLEKTYQFTDEQLETLKTITQ